MALMQFPKLEALPFKFGLFKPLLQEASHELVVVKELSAGWKFGALS